MWCSVIGLALCLSALTLTSSSESSTPLDVPVKNSEKRKTKIFKRNIKVFHEWFETSGGQRKGINLDIVKGRNIGVLAKEKVVIESKILSIPMSIILTEKTIQSSLRKMRSTSNVKRALQGLKNSDDLVTLFLMYEDSLGEKSRWAPYIKMFPQNIQTVAFFNQSEINALQDPIVIGLVDTFRNRLDKKYRTLKHTLNILFASVPKEQRSKYISKQAWMHWETLVGSRALVMRGKRYLAPFADMFNFRPQQGDRERAQGQNFLHYHRIEGSMFNVYADRSTGVGEQVFEDYGDNPNLVYLIHHGFLPAENPFDCVHLPMPLLRAGDANVELKRHLLEDTHDVRRMSENFAECVDLSGLSARTMLYLRVLVMDDSDCDACRLAINDEIQFSGGNRQVQTMAIAKAAKRCVATNHDEEIYDHIFLTVKKKLASFATSLAQDEAILASSDGHGYLQVGAAVGSSMSLVSVGHARILCFLVLVTRPHTSMRTLDLGIAQANPLASPSLTLKPVPPSPYSLTLLPPSPSSYSLPHPTPSLTLLRHPTPSLTLLRPSPLDSQ